MQRLCTCVMARTIVAAPRRPGRVRVHRNTRPRVSAAMTQTLESDIVPRDAELFPFRPAAAIGCRCGRYTNSAVEIVKSVEDRRAEDAPSFLRVVEETTQMPLQCHADNDRSGRTALARSLFCTRIDKCTVSVPEPAPCQSVEIGSRVMPAEPRLRL